jgi:hypothetical protein
LLPRWPGIKWEPRSGVWNTLQLATEKDTVSKALHLILESSYFHSSKQCQNVLRYIVEKTLNGEEGSLKERAIGAAVFGRPPGYDTGNDPIVRARVAEVRKRLGQYYLEYRQESPVTITIPNGTYRACFSFEAPLSALPANGNSGGGRSADHAIVSLPAPVKPEVPAEAPDRSQSRFNRIRRVAGLILLLCAVSGAVSWRLAKRSAEAAGARFQQFWRPLSQSARPVVVYIGANYAYRISPEFLEEYATQHRLQYSGPEFFIDLDPGGSIQNKNLLPTKNLIGFGDVAATSRIVATLTTFNTKYDLRYGDDIAVTDLSSSPVILIGGFSNPWALQLTRKLRYTLEGGDKIVDRQNPSKTWQITGDESARSGYDYVLVSRLLQADTGSFALVIAGIGSSGNQAAAEFVSNADRLTQALHAAPANWQNLNMQLVLRTRVVGDVPVATDVQAMFFW